jgi:hypothetical protein
MPDEHLQWNKLIAPMIDPSSTAEEYRRNQAAKRRPQLQHNRIRPFQLISAPYKRLATDAANKLVVDDKQQLFRIDNTTGETSILQFTPEQNRQMQGVWLTLAK